MMLWRSALAALSLSICVAAQADVFGEALARLQLEELRETQSQENAVDLLGGHGAGLTDEGRVAAAVLVAAGVLIASDVSDVALSAHKIDRFVYALNTPAPELRGRIGDPTTLSRMVQQQSYEALLTADSLLDGLGQLLVEGVITGYDLRRNDVYANAPAGYGFVYSHSSWRHLRQLVALMQREGVTGWVSVAPKVSAFLFREGWGSGSPDLVRLPSGQRVVQGKEMATLFEFDDPDSRLRFHELVTKYAKKDQDDEPGLIADSWWQPYYYTDEALPGFAKIDLVIVSDDQREATLTVLEENTPKVIAALENYPWRVRVDPVWVNPPFKRFLEGGYK